MNDTATEVNYITPQQDGLPLCLTCAEASKILRCSLSLTYRMARNGTIPALSLGKRRLVIPTQALLHYLEKAPDGNAKQP